MDQRYFCHSRSSATRSLASTLRPSALSYWFPFASPMVRSRRIHDDVALGIMSIDAARDVAPVFGLMRIAPVIGVTRRLSLAVRERSLRSAFGFIPPRGRATQLHVTVTSPPTSLRAAVANCPASVSPTETRTPSGRLIALFAATAPR